MIYFLAKPDRSAIKIGTTVRLATRLQQLAAERWKVSEPAPRRTEGR